MTNEDDSPHRQPPEIFVSSCLQIEQGYTRGWNWDYSHLHTLHLGTSLPGCSAVSYTGETAPPKHQHHTPISTRYSLYGPTLQNLSNFSALYRRGLSCKVLRMLGGCDEVQATSVLASTLRASTCDIPHEGGYWVVTSLSWALLFFTVRPWCLYSSMSADLEVGLVWVLGCPGIIAMKRWGCSPSRSGAHLHHCLLCEGFNELVSRYSFIKTVRFSPALHRSSDTPLPPLEPLLPRTKNKKPHITLEGRRWVVQYVYVWARFVSR